MNDRKDATDAPHTTPEKCALASKTIKEKRGSLAALEYDSAVMRYVTQGKEPEKLDGFMSVAWPHTKAMIDEDRKSREMPSDAQYRGLKDLLAHLGKVQEGAREKELAPLAEEIDATTSELKDFFEEYGDTFGVESYEKEVTEGNARGSYADFLELGLTASESDISDYAREEVEEFRKMYFERHGKEISHDEMLDRYSRILRRRDFYECWRYWDDLGLKFGG